MRLNVRIKSNRHKDENKKGIIMSYLKNYILLPLILIGALNWGLIGILNFDLVALIFGGGTYLAKIVYSAVGISALFYIIMLISNED